MFDYSMFVDFKQCELIAQLKRNLFVILKNIICDMKNQSYIGYDLTGFSASSLFPYVFTSELLAWSHSVEVNI